MSQFSHIDDEGNMRMVDVSRKPISTRKARARGLVRMAPETVGQIRAGNLAKGNPLETARLAGILAAKQTAQLIPLCHPLNLTHVDIRCRILDVGVELEASVTSEGKTGVEMEALTAVSIAALTIYDMCKALDRDMIVSDIRLIEKSGGRSGHYIRFNSKAGD